MTMKWLGVTTSLTNLCLSARPPHQHHFASTLPYFRLSPDKLLLLKVLCSGSTLLTDNLPQPHLLSCLYLYVVISTDLSVFVMSFLNICLLLCIYLCATSDTILALLRCHPSICSLLIGHLSLLNFRV
ncbi:hypothetical protein S83_001120 [Arachis hypogaea]